MQSNKNLFGIEWYNEEDSTSTNNNSKGTPKASDSVNITIPNHIPITISSLPECGFKIIYSLNKSRSQESQDYAEKLVEGVLNGE